VLRQPERAKVSIQNSLSTYRYCNRAILVPLSPDMYVFFCFLFFFLVAMSLEGAGGRSGDWSNELLIP